MSSRLIVIREQFPHAIPDNTVTGNQLTFAVTARVRRLEDKLIDTTSLGAPLSFAIGQHECELVILDISREHT